LKPTAKEDHKAKVEDEFTRDVDSKPGFTFDYNAELNEEGRTAAKEEALAWETASEEVDSGSDAETDTTDVNNTSDPSRLSAVALQRRLKKIRGGSASYYEQTQFMVEKGPLSAWEFANHTFYNIQLLADTMVGGKCPLEVLRNFFDRPMFLLVDFAGRRGVETAIKGCEIELDANYGVAGGWLKLYRACERYRPMTKMLMTGPLTPTHAFKHRDEMFNTTAEANVNEPEPLKTSSKEEKERYNLDYAKSVAEKRDAIFTDVKTSDKCMLHPQGACSVRPQLALNEKATVVGAGAPVCNPWCQGGGHAKLSHDSIPSYVDWFHESHLNSVNLLEQAPGMDPAIYEKGVPLDDLFLREATALTQTHIVKISVFGGSDLGAPCDRKRLRGMSAKQADWVWIGAGDGMNVTEDFLKVFRRQVVATGDIFANLDSDANILKHRNELTRRANKRRKRNKVDGELTPDALTLEELVPPHAFENAKAYHKIFNAPNYDKFPDNVMIADLSQNVQGKAGETGEKKRFTRGRCGPWLPTLQCSSVPALMSKDSVEKTYLFTAKELSFSQGFPEFPELLKTNALHSILPFDISGLGYGFTIVLRDKGGYQQIVFKCKCYIYIYIYIQREMCSFVICWLL
jgi:hypothetical protein